MAATTTLLDLVTPTQGTLSGTWGDTVNYGITDYLDIAIAGTLSFAGDGAITLTKTIGSASGNNIGSTTAQYMVIRVTGTLTTPKIITAPSNSKLYMVDNSATGSTVSFIRAGQTPAVSVAVGEKCFVYYNGTDYVKVASSVADGVTTIDFGSTGLTPATATSGAVTVAGTLAVANGGTGITSFGTGIATFLGTPSSANLAAALTDETGSGSAVFATSPTLVTPILGTPQSATLTNATGLPISSGVSGLGTNVATALAVNIGSAGAPVVNGGVLGTPSSGTLTNATGLPLTTGVTGILPIANGGTATATPALVQGANITITGTWPNQTIAAAGAAQVYPGAGIANSTGSAWGTSYTTTGTGTVVALATSPTLVTPVLGTPSSGTLSSCTVDGTNSVGFKNIPQSGSAKTTSYTLAITDVGKVIEVGASGAIEVPDSTFATGDAVIIFNNTSGAITMTMTITNAYIAGTDTDKATISVATRGVANILFVTGTTCVVTGNVS
jgi:hypothetical protein